MGNKCVSKRSKEGKKIFRTRLIIVIVLILGIIVFIFLVSNFTDRTPFLEDRRYDSVTFSSQERAIEKAFKIGCNGLHTHIQEGETIFMSCERHDILDSYIIEKFGEEPMPTLSIPSVPNQTIRGGSIYG